MYSLAVPHSSLTQLTIFFYLQRGIPALIIMASTIVIKGLCWLWCRLVKNSSVQALYVNHLALGISSQI